MLTVEYSERCGRVFWHSPERGAFWETPNGTSSTSAAYGAAAESSSATRRVHLAYRKACNQWKHDLHRRFAHAHVVDLGCGRGGDLGKMPPHVLTYVGFDGAPKALEEARRRNEETYHRNCTLALVDLSKPLSPAVEEALRAATCVACMFALHYFPDLLSTLDRLLPSGAIIYGVAPHAPFVRRLLACPQIDLPVGFRLKGNPEARTYEFEIAGLVQGEEHYVEWPALEASLKRLRLQECRPLQSSLMPPMYSSFVLQVCVHPLASIMPFKPRHPEASNERRRRPDRGRDHKEGHQRHLNGLPSSAHGTVRPRHAHEGTAARKRRGGVRDHAHRP